MKPYKISYNKSRFPNQPKRGDGSWGCRGCGGDIPKGRRAWCSRQCCETFHPAFVISNVRKRDKDICAFCGFDHEKAMDEWWKQKPNADHYGWQDHHKWIAQKPVVNFDHIIPFSEGGMTVLENMRTLCEPCHKQRTKNWHADKKRDTNQLPLIKSELANVAPVG